ncbi:hypothetical protein TOPH_03284 [Tolypocladium ophioglossoides CBS 100239]|uniref:Protein kinase domain-containing protein n=1 Tax=Tolypocladium ophioglossoides (strain CBS 100239) TaxID=1163406 RepID=A0A0L0ND90_TOLOC|nr:hypothetical protein TOPH_03284 [Tolypocladium ophioglossoides CBS 100239]
MLSYADISGANIAFTATQLVHLSEEDLFNVIGSPQSTELARVDGKPLCPSLLKQLVQKAIWDDWTDEDEEDIRLLDWGEAFLHGAEPAKLAQPGDLRVPEIIFTTRFDRRVDLWRAGCTYSGDEAVLVAQMINFVEELPTEWQTAWQAIQDSSGSSGRRFPTGGATKSKLDRRFYEMVGEPELLPLLPIIQGLMRFLPSKRISGAEAVSLL